MKICSKCGLNKALSEFYVKDSRKNKLHAQCKSCFKEHRKTYCAKHYEQYKEQYRARAKISRKKRTDQFHNNMLAYLQGKVCNNCGENDIRVLEFDHLDPLTKKFGIGQSLRLGYTWSQALDEIKKCQILCANCHKIRTAEQFGWYKS